MNVASVLFAIALATSVFPFVCVCVCVKTRVRENVREDLFEGLGGGGNNNNKKTNQFQVDRKAGLPWVDRFQASHISLDEGAEVRRPLGSSRSGPSHLRRLCTSRPVSLPLSSSSPSGRSWAEVGSGSDTSRGPLPPSSLLRCPSGSPSPRVRRRTLRPASG